MRFLSLAVCLLVTQTAAGLESLWQADIGHGARSLPVVADHNADGSLDVLVTTRFDGTVWIVGADGKERNRFTQDYWLEGLIAAAPQPGSRAPLFAYQESAGDIDLSDYTKRLNLWLHVDGEACIGTGPCLADLDGDGRAEILVARRNGCVTAVDQRLKPLWQFDAGLPFDSSPAAAPVFKDQAGVYALARDGAVHGLAGNGAPLWRFQMAHAAPRFPSKGDLLVVELVPGKPTVLAGDAEGWLYAIDAVTGRELWHVNLGGEALGTPAIADVLPSEGREIVVVSEAGHIAVVDPHGVVLLRGELPEGRYVPRPLLADVDGDAESEIILAAEPWAVVVAGLDGNVEERIEVRGNVKEGVLLADLTGNGRLELLVATECARLYCFATEAEQGWTHPRGGPSLSGSVPPFSREAETPDMDTSGRSVRLRDVFAPRYEKGMPLAKAVLCLRRPPASGYLTAKIRLGDSIVGAAVKPAASSTLTIPFVQLADEPYSLDVDLVDADGKVTASTRNTPIRTAPLKATELAPVGYFIDVLGACADAFTPPEWWAPPEVGGSDSWHVAHYMPDKWRTYGLDDEPFIRDAIPRIPASASRSDGVFGPSHAAWEPIAGDTKPFFIMNDYFRPRKAYSDDAYARILKMAGERFLGFQVHEWAYHVWKNLLEDSATPPTSREAATAVMKEDFETVLDMCHGRMYEGQGYCLFHHQAFAWDAPLGYAEVGENIPCAPLQFAFLRGASRQYGGRPWGAYLSNWFRGTVVDTRYRPEDERVRWGKSDYADGPDCGHSASLEFRLEMAAHLSGATFVHHESDAHHDSIFMEESAPGEYGLSEFGTAMKAWHAYTQKYPERGLPYTPIAFLVDPGQGWRPREDIYGIWPRQRGALGMEGVFAHVFPYGGRVDFERGYLANGPYGDIFDVLTDEAKADALHGYAVVWPLGRCH